MRNLKTNGYENIHHASRQEVDLRNQEEVNRWFSLNSPEFVFHAAGRVGGILANLNFPSQFLYDNIMMSANIISASKNYRVKKLLNLGSSCIYPKFANQPIDESALLSGQLEPTNEAYAIAKIAGIKLCDAYRTEYGCNFISAMPTNLYGPGDNFSENSSHVIPALIRKFEVARKTGASSVQIWGSGTPLREFLHVDDLADACRFLMLNFDSSGPINVGVGKDISILNLATLLKKVIYSECQLMFDASKPDGTPQKCLDVRRIFSLGWQPKIGLVEGLTSTYNWYLENQELVRATEG